MKQFLSIAIFMVFAAMVTSCSAPTDTPTGVSEKFIELMQAKDYEAIGDLVYVDPGTSAEDEAQGKAMITGLLAEKGGKQLETKQGIVSYETTSEEISEDGMKAVVKTTITYGDGTTDEQKSKTIKGEDGKWYLDMSK